MGGGADIGAPSREAEPHRLVRSVDAVCGRNRASTDDRCKVDTECCANAADLAASA